MTITDKPYATHWQPLPAPPRAPGEEGEKQDG